MKTKQHMALEPSYLRGSSRLQREEAIPSYAHAGMVSPSLNPPIELSKSSPDLYNDCAISHRYFISANMTWYQF